MASPATSTRRQPAWCDSHTSRDQCPFFGGDMSDWWALQPAEQAEVILAAYQEQVLP